MDWGLYNHMIVHEHEKYRCDICNREYARLESLTRYITMHFSSSMTQYRECKICGKVFSRTQQLHLHYRRHVGETRYVCQYCNKTFCNTSCFKRHVQRHLGDRRHSCNVCSKAFYTPRPMKDHMNIHTRENDHNVICVEESSHSSPACTGIDKSTRLTRDTSVHSVIASLYRVTLLNVTYWYTAVRNHISMTNVIKVLDRSTSSRKGNFEYGSASKVNVVIAGMIKTFYTAQTYRPL